MPSMPGSGTVVPPEVVDEVVEVLVPPLEVVEEVVVPPLEVVEEVVVPPLDVVDEVVVPPVEVDEVEVPHIPAPIESPQMQ